MTRNAPVRQTSTTRRHSPRSWSTTAARVDVPALLTTTSTRPCVGDDAVEQRGHRLLGGHVADDVRAARRGRPPPPCTRRPPRARAQAAPIPDAPPTTTATRSATNPPSCLQRKLTRVKLVPSVRHVPPLKRPTTAVIGAGHQRADQSARCSATTACPTPASRPPTGSAATGRSATPTGTAAPTARCTSTPRSTGCPSGTSRCPRTTPTSRTTPRSRTTSTRTPTRSACASGSSSRTAWCTPSGSPAAAGR